MQNDSKIIKIEVTPEFKQSLRSLAKRYRNSNSHYGKSLMQKAKTGFHLTEMRHRKTIIKSKLIR